MVSRWVHDGTRRMRGWARPVLAVPYAIASSATSLPPDKLFRYITPKQWSWVNTYGGERFRSFDHYLPSMPADQVQIAYTGQRGTATLQEAFSFYQVVSREAPRDQSHTVLDFGCGWGRITRFFIKDYPKDRLFGVDPMPEMIEICRETNPWATFHDVDLLPPIDLPDGSLDLLFAFSVFSHLTEPVHLQWLAEFARLLRSGGMLIVTTREREFILECERLRAEQGDSSSDELGDLAKRGARSAFLDTKKYLDVYDSGDYCCDPVGAGTRLVSAVYGETCIPYAYVRDRWQPEFSVLKYLDNVDGVKQNVIVARRA